MFYYEMALFFLLLSIVAQNSSVTLTPPPWRAKRPDPELLPWCPQIDCPPSAYGWKKKPEASSDPFTDFEFRLHDDPVAMLPADQLFADGKLMPPQLTAARPDPPKEKRSGPENEPESARVDPYLFSPKDPRCSSHWREHLGLRKLHHKANATTTTTTVSAGKSIQNFLHRRCL